MVDRDLLNRVVELELDMFERVRVAEPSICQERPETFKSMRAMTHSALSDETLRSYLNDLLQANMDGKNLLTLKYARMEDKIPALKNNTVIGDIVKIEERWMQELTLRYPRVVKGDTGFRNYLSSELETYSDKTLELYFRDVSEAGKQGRNLAEERYNWLFERIGYGSLAEASKKARDSKEERR